MMGAVQELPQNRVGRAGNRIQNSVTPINTFTPVPFAQFHASPLRYIFVCGQVRDHPFLEMKENPKMEISCKYVTCDIAAI